MSNEEESAVIPANEQTIKPRPFGAVDIILIIAVVAVIALISFGGIRALIKPQNEAASADITADEQYAINTAKKAEADIQDMMKDPDATKFKQLVANGKAQCVTGQVMGKNSYGAYEGYKTFVWDHGKITIQSDGPVEAIGASFACEQSMEKFGGNKLSADPA